jgi:hypothetical protein
MTSEFEFIPTQPPSLRPDIIGGYRVTYFGKEIGNIWRTAIGWTHECALSLPEERSEGKPPWKTFRTRHQAVGDLLQAKLEHIPPLP